MIVNQNKKDIMMPLPMMNTQEMMTTKSQLRLKNLKFSSSLSVTILMKVHFQKFLESTVLWQNANLLNKMVVQEVLPSLNTTMLLQPRKHLQQKTVQNTWVVKSQLISQVKNHKMLVEIEILVNLATLKKVLQFSLETLVSIQLKTQLEISSQKLVKSQVWELHLEMMVVQEVSVTLNSKIHQWPKMHWN